MIIRHQCTIAAMCLLTSGVSTLRAEDSSQVTPEQNRFFDSVVETEEEGTSVLIIPMEGQMHTDINHTVFDDCIPQTVIDLNTIFLFLLVEHYSMTIINMIN